MCMVLLMNRVRFSGMIDRSDRAVHPKASDANLFPTPIIAITERVMLCRILLVKNKR